MWKSQKAPNGRFDAIEELLDGQLERPSNRQSTLFFTVHKAASSFVARLLDQIALAEQMRIMDFDGYVFAAPETEKNKPMRSAIKKVLSDDSVEVDAELQSALRGLFLSQGCSYGPIRRPTLLNTLENLDDFQTMILLRDPRDCLTSLYFSLAFSHRTPANKEIRDQFNQYREQVRSLEIDEFVRQEAPNWLARFQAYCDALDKYPMVHLLKYEQLVLDFDSWLERVVGILDIKLHRRTKNRLVRMANFKVDREDVNSHKRQVLPGDHRRKLRPETIDEVTEVMRPVLVSLGYPVDGTDVRAA